MLILHFMNNITLYEICIVVEKLGARHNCPPTLVEGDCSNVFIRPTFVRQSVDKILSPHLFLQFSREFDETFQLLFP